MIRSGQLSNLLILLEFNLTEIQTTGPEIGDTGDRETAGAVMTLVRASLAQPFISFFVWFFNTALSDFCGTFELP